MNDTRLKELRRSKGWTQDKLAETSGVAVRTIQRLEAGEDASLDTLGLLADALGVPVAELFTTVERDELEDAIRRLDEAREDQQRERREHEEQSAARRRRIVRALLAVLGVLLFLLAVLLVSHLLASSGGDADAAGWAGLAGWTDVAGRAIRSS